MAVEYHGRLQSERWKLHPEDFQARIAWEVNRQRVLDLQVEAIEKGLPDPEEKIPPIPELRYPDWRPGDSVHAKAIKVSTLSTPKPDVHAKVSTDRKAYKAAHEKERRRKKRESQIGSEE